MSEARFQAPVTKVNEAGAFSAQLKMPPQVPVVATGNAFYVQGGRVVDSFTGLNRGESYCHFSFTNPKSTGRASRAGAPATAPTANLFALLGLPDADGPKNKYADIDGPMKWDAFMNSASFNFKTKAPLVLSVVCPLTGVADASGASTVRTVADLYRKIRGVLGPNGEFEILFK